MTFLPGQRTLPSPGLHNHLAMWASAGPGPLSVEGGWQQLPLAVTERTNVKRLAAGLVCAGQCGSHLIPPHSPPSLLCPCSQPLFLHLTSSFGLTSREPHDPEPQMPGLPSAHPAPWHVSPCSLSFYSLRCMVLSSLINHPARAKSWVTASLCDILMNGQHFPGMNWMQTQLLMCSLSLRLKDQTGNWTPPVTPSSGF